MPFRKSPPPQVVPDSPEKILLDLPRRKIPGVLLHQGEVMRTYAATAVTTPDVALQLPTGSGKTLVGLMIGEWRRRKFNEESFISADAPTCQSDSGASGRAIWPER